MSYFEKPGSSYCKKDGKTHRSLEYKARRTKNFGTIRKEVIGTQNLSKKNKARLYDFTDDNFIPNIYYTLKKYRRWELAESSVDFLENVTPIDNEYSVAMVKSRSFSFYCCTSYKSYALKPPKEETKVYEVQTGKGATLMCLQNHLVELEPKTNGKKRKKYSAMRKFEEAPSIMFVMDEQHPSDYAFEASIFKYKHSKWPKQIAEKRRREKKHSIYDYDDGIDFLGDELAETSNAHQTTLSISDCVVTKEMKKANRRKKCDSLDIIAQDDEVFDKIKQRPKVVFHPNLSKFERETNLYVMKEDSIATLNFEGIEFMYDILWLNEEKSKCLLIVPKMLDKNFSNFNSFLILEFFDGRKKRLRVTACSLHSKNILLNAKPNTVFHVLKCAIIELWKMSIQNVENFNSYRCPSMLSKHRTPLFFTVGTPVGDFDLLFQTQNVKSTSNMDIFSFDIRCHICHGRNATALDCGHNFCQDCSSKFIKDQIEIYQDFLSCHICLMPLNPIFVFISTPFLLLRAYLRSKYFEHKLTTECPNCIDVIVYKDKNAVNIKCSRCCIAFCRKCKQAPHFPLLCSKMKQWKTQMSKQIWFTFYGDIQCSCKNIIKLSQNHEYLEQEDKKVFCSNCSRQYIISWSQMKLPRLLFYNKTITNFLEADVQHFISDSIASTSVDAFVKRTTETYQNKMVQKISAISSLTSTDARIIINESLHLLEYGTAWIHYKRKALTIEENLFKKNLYSIHSLLIQIEMNRITVANAKWKIKELEKLLQKTFVICKEIENIYNDNNT